MRILILLFFLCPVLLLAQTEAHIHPTQVGLFGAANGDFMTANTATNGGQWTSAASMQGSLLLPLGNENRTIRHNGASWEETYNLKVLSSGLVGIGNTTATSFSGTMLTVNGGIEMRYTPKIHSYALGLDAHFGFNESSGAPGFFYNATTDGGAIKRSNTGPLWFIEFGRAGAAMSFGSVPSGSRAVGSTLSWNDGAERMFLNSFGALIIGPDFYDYPYMTEAELLNVGGNVRVKLDLLVQRAFLANGSAGATDDILCSRGPTSSTIWRSPATIVANGGGIYTAGTGISISGNVVSNTGDTNANNDINNTQNNGSAMTQRNTLNLVSTSTINMALTDNSGLGTTEIRANIPAGAVGTTEIAADAVTSAKIPAGAISGFDIANNTVTSTNLNTTGVSSGTYGSSTQSPVINVGTDGRIISASNTTITAPNLYNADGTIPGSTTRVVTIDDGAAIRFDASAYTTTPITAIQIRGNATTLATRFLEFQDTDGTMRFRMLANSGGVTLSSTSRSIEINGTTTVGLTCNTGQFIVDQAGYFRLNSLTSDPGSPQNGSFWANTTDNRLKVRYNSLTQAVATLENDIIGDAVSARSASFTMPAQEFYTVADANGSSFTITFDDTMREGIDYVIECRRNGTNTITFDAGSGFNLAVDTVSSFPDDGAVAMGAGGTGIQAAHKVYYVRRHGSSISVK